MRDNAPLPWHQLPWQQIQQRRVANRLPHALLLTGATGLGKGRFARRLAQAVLCAQPNREGDACGQCRSCRLFQAGSHPDYRLTEPEDAGKAIKVDAIRTLNTFLNQTAQYGGYKVVIVQPADQLNLSAANSLLKMLEEPPGQGLWLLVSAQPARLPATVRSRCQRLHFATATPQAALPWLSQHLEGDLEPATLLALAGGAPLTALALADPTRWQRRQTLFNGYQQLWMGQADPVRLAETWTRTGEVIEALRWLVDWHTDLVRLKMSPDPPRLSCPDLRSALGRWAQSQSARTLMERWEAALRLYVLGANTSVNPALLLEAFFSEALPVSS